MAAEYSYPLAQVVAADENILFLNGDRCCKKGFILHNNTSGIFRLKGICKNCACKATYKVNFHANVAVAPAADGGVLEPVTLALTQNGETLMQSYSAPPMEQVETYIETNGGSEFLKAVDGRKADKVWKLMDELVEAVKILHPRMYTTFIDKVQDL